MGRRKNGTGGVSHRKDGRWEGRIVVDYDENGKPKTKNITAKTKAECLKKAQKSKALDRSLEVEIPQEVYDRLAREIEVQHG